MEIVSNQLFNIKKRQSSHQVANNLRNSHFLDVKQLSLVDE
jgi:hypothetical protein